MILADTSVWVGHFRSGVPAFADALERGLISTHPVVIGELATGNLAKRAQTLAMLQRLPGTMSRSPDECLRFIENCQLFGRGIGWSDVQLLVAARAAGDVLWSLDKRLVEAARGLNLAFEERS